jgi:hypothetical protein
MHAKPPTPMRRKTRMLINNLVLAKKHARSPNALKPDDAVSFFDRGIVIHYFVRRKCGLAATR